MDLHSTTKAENPDNTFAQAVIDKELANIEDLKKEKNPIPQTQPFIVDRFYFHNSSAQFVKVQKYFRRKKLAGHFEEKKSGSLKEFLKWIESQYKVSKALNKFNKHLVENKHIGYISDQIFLEHNPVKVPPPPVQLVEEDDIYLQNWDLLAFNGEISKYSNCVPESTYWCKATLLNSDCFVLNYNKIPSIIEKMNEILKKCESATIQDIFKLNLETFVVSQYYFVHNSKTSVQKCKERITDSVQFQKVVNKYNIECSKMLKQLTIDHSVCEKQKDLPDKLLPKVSLIMILTDANTAFHNLVAFNQIDYPKLELIVLDYKKIERKIKHLYNKDKRIKIVQLENKDDSDIPYGYLLNAAIKSTVGDIIVNFSNGNYYNAQNFKDLIVSFMLSNKDVFIGNPDDNLVYDFRKERTYQKQNSSFSIHNMVFLKKIWERYSFDERENDQDSLIFNFIKDRLSLCSTYNSFFWNTYLQYVPSQTKLLLCDEKEQYHSFKEKDTFRIILSVYKKIHMKTA